MDMKEVLKAGIEAALQEAIKSGALPEGTYPDVFLEVPPQKEFGDFSTNLAMQSARVARKAPKIIAEAIVAQMKYDWLEKADIAGAGFINFYLKSDVIYDSLKGILEAGESYGKQELRARDTIQVEYISANPTGPLHVGHGRGAAYGSALVNLLRDAGYNVQAEYYVNDAGNQVDNLAISVEMRFQELQGAQLVFSVKQEDGSYVLPEEIPDGALIFPDNGYRGPDVIKTAQAIVDKEGFDKLNAMSREERIAYFKEVAVPEKLEDIKSTLDHFNIKMDAYFSEKSLYGTDEVKMAVEQLRQLGHIYEKDGALWFRTTSFGDDKDRCVIRDNGVPTYFASDIAYHRNKYERGFNEMIDIWGADHHGYVARVKAAIKGLDYNPDKLTIMLLQMMALYRGGQKVSLSKRSGQSLTLDELLEEVGVDAARYFFVMRSLDSQLDFDIDLAKSKSNENPVYYIQYAYARIHSIYHQLQDAGIAYGNWEQTDFTTLTSELELELIKKMIEYPEEVVEAARRRAPHRIAQYLYDLASLFHSFYRQGRIMGVDSTLQEARIGLITAVARVLKQGLTVLGISAPEKM